MKKIKGTDYVSKSFFLINDNFEELEERIKVLEEKIVLLESQGWKKKKRGK